MWGMLCVLSALCILDAAAIGAGVDPIKNGP